MSTKPNLLLIMYDQLRADVLGCYGNDLVKTPNMDRLAKRGICFDRAYSQTPVCMPARHALTSGKNAFELGMLENTYKRNEINNPLAKLVRDEGYFTCAVGKMHFTPAREHFGFDRMYLSEEIPEHIQDDDYLQFLQEKGYGHVIEPHGKRSETYYVPQVSELPEELHTSAWTADKTCEIIRKNSNRPFFIFSSFIKPHPPFEPCKPYDTMYTLDKIPMPVRDEGELDPDDRIIDIQNGYKVNGIENVSDEDVRKIRAHYYGSVTQLDKQLGKLLDTLDVYGLTDNTLVILTSDHGEMLGDHYAFGKRTYYEQSTRIPFIVSWPEMLPQGERREQFVILQDIFATFVSAAGGQIPGDVAGKDIIEVCKDSQRPLRKKVFAEYGADKNLKFMLRWGDFKYIYHTNGGLENLYNLKNDPEEFKNIAVQNPEICAGCRDELVAYYKSRGFEEALDGERLKRYEYEKAVSKGYINQQPHWSKTIVE